MLKTISIFIPGLATSSLFAQTKVRRPLLILALALSGHAQQASPSGGKNVPDILADMEGEDMHTKIVAFKGLMTQR
jgi:hypothetical protein